MNRFLIIISFGITGLFFGCNSIFESPDSVAERFVGFISNKQYANAYLMFSSNRKELFDTATFKSPLDFLPQFSDGNKFGAHKLSKDLYQMMEDSSKFSYRVSGGTRDTINYILIINTFDPEAIMKAALSEMQNLSVVQIFAYTLLNEQNRMKLVEQRLKEYLDNSTNLPRKDMEVPFKVIFDGMNYVIE